MTYELRVTGRMDPPTLVRVRQEYAQLSAEKRSSQNPDYRGFNLSESIAAQNPWPGHHPVPHLWRRYPA